MIARFLLALAAILAVSAPARATVNTSQYSTNVLCNGSQTVFTYSFIGLAPANIQVLLTDSSGNQTNLVQGSGPSQYTATTNPPVQGATLGVGGTVVYPNSGGACAAGSTLTISRIMPLVQGVSLQNQASFGQYSKSAESGLDLLELQLQQVNGTLGRSIVANPANSTGPAPLPPAAQMANMGLCGDSTGLNVIACTLPASGVISAAMQPVVNAASLAAGRTAFGLGSIATEGIGAGLQDDGAGNARVNAGFVSDAVNTSVTAAFHQTQRAASGPFTYTFPRANTLWSGFGFWIYPTLGTVTLSIDSHDSIAGQAAGVGLALPVNAAVYVTTDAASSGKWYVRASASSTPASSRTALTSGSGTYTTPGEAVRLRVRMVGGGGGGGGAGSGTTAGAGGAGGTTSFGSFTAVGGSGGAANSSAFAGDGGAGGTGGSGSAFLRMRGQYGGGGGYNNGSGGPVLSGPGGASVFGGAGVSSEVNTSAYKDAATNSGSGGAGSTNSSYGNGGGGGAGEYVEFDIISPAASYSYSVGSGGAAGAAGTSGTVGGAGGSGAIYVEALFN